MRGFWGDGGFLKFGWLCGGVGVLGRWWGFLGDGGGGGVGFWGMEVGTGGRGKGRGWEGYVGGGG